MKVSDLKVNQNVYIENITSKENIIYLASRIEDIGSNYITLAAPIKNGTIVPLHVGEELTVKLIFRYSFFGFKSKIISRELHPLPTVTLELVSDEILPTEQRRQHVRVKAALSFQLEILEALGNLKKNELFDCITRDISTGGLAFYTKFIHFQVNQIVRIVIHMPNQIDIPTEALIVRIASHKINDETLYEVALQYIQINERDQDRIAFYVFAKQRELIKREL